MPNDEVQRQLDALPHGAVLELHPLTHGREIEGPLVIRRGVTLDGHGATLWSRRGPALSVEAAKVTVRNLVVEVTDPPAGSGGPEACALAVAMGAGATFAADGLEVSGGVAGLPGEDGAWDYPPALPLGRFAYGRDVQFVVRLSVPVRCELRSDVTGLSVHPPTLRPGMNEVVLTAEDGIPKDTLLYGNLTLQTPTVRRRIRVSGHVAAADGTWPAAAPPNPLWEPSGALAPAPPSMEPSAAGVLPPPDPRLHVPPPVLPPVETVVAAPARPPMPPPEPVRVPPRYPERPPAPEPPAVTERPPLASLRVPPPPTTTTPSPSPAAAASGTKSRRINYGSPSVGSAFGPPLNSAGGGGPAVEPVTSGPKLGGAFAAPPASSADGVEPEGSNAVPKPPESEVVAPPPLTSLRTSRPRPVGIGSLFGGPVAPPPPPPPKSSSPPGAAVEPPRPSDAPPAGPAPKPRPKRISLPGVFGDTAT